MSLLHKSHTGKGSLKKRPDNVWSLRIVRITHSKVNDVNKRRDYFVSRRNLHIDLIYIHYTYIYAHIHTLAQICTYIQTYIHSHVRT